MDGDGYRTGVVQDKTLAHQIQLVFASQFTLCMNGDKVLKSDVVVTCNCQRIGSTMGFYQYLGAAPVLEKAWLHYNNHLEKENS